MTRYDDIESGFRVIVFRPDSKEELAEIKAWCRKHIGRSHGPGHGTWWIRRVRPSKLGMKYQDELLMTTGPYIFLAQLTWA